MNTYERVRSTCSRPSTTRRIPQLRKIQDNHLLPIQTTASPLTGATSIAGKPQNTV